MTRSVRISAATRTRRTVTESPKACQPHCATQIRARSLPDPSAWCLAACDRLRLIRRPVHSLEARASLSSLRRRYYNCTPLYLLPRQSFRSSTFLFRVQQAIHLLEPRGGPRSAGLLPFKLATSDHPAIDTRSCHHTLAHHVDNCNCASTSRRCWGRRSLSGKTTKPKPQSRAERPRRSE